MQHFLFKVGRRKYSSPRAYTLRKWIKNQLVLDKLETPTGYLVLGIIALVLSYAIVSAEARIAWLILLNVILLPAMLGAMLSARFGIYVLSVGAFAVASFERFVPTLPLDSYLDATILIMLFGILVRQSRERDWTFLRNGLSAVLTIYLAYQGLQLFNPLAPNGMAWVQAFRESGLILLLFFAALFAWQKFEDLRFFTFFWISLVTLCCLYGFVQAVGDLPSYELNWLLENKDRFLDFYTWGGPRVFSIFFDPTTFGILLASTILLSGGVLADSSLKSWHKGLIVLAMLIMFVAMVLSRTRTAFVILPAGFIFFALLSMDKRLMAAAGIMTLLLAAFVIAPIQNPSIRNFQKAFHPEESLNYQIQMENLSYLQSHIQKHAMGSGLGTTGEIGERYAPHSRFSAFLTRSGYIQTAVEMGWVGLALFLLMIGTALWIGVRTYFRLPAGNAKIYNRSFLTVILVLLLAHYPHQILTQWPTNILFVLSMAIVVHAQREV
ncbi:MAG: O-antigen ligase family protein [Bacteroidota bacterium]